MIMNYIAPIRNQKDYDSFIWKWRRINRIVFDVKYNGNDINTTHDSDFNAKEIFFQYQKWKLSK